MIRVNNKKVFIILNSTWNVINFRLGLIRHLLSIGFDITVLAPKDYDIAELKLLGCKFIHLSLKPRGLSFFSDLISFLQILYYLILHKPNVVLSFTIKPNLYGSLASFFLGIPIINNVAGLGSIYLKKNFLSLIVSLFYKFVFLNSFFIFFQNHNDHKYFIKKKIVNRFKTKVLPGSGINLNLFQPHPLPNIKSVNFLLVSRMLWEKGIKEYVDAASLLKSEGLDVSFSLLGFIDDKLGGSITNSQIQDWVKNKNIVYLGESDDVRTAYKNADCVVLPSYYPEGTPRVLLEASAMARPIVTCNTVGCKDVVTNNENGFLCKPKDYVDLADKLRKFCFLPHKERIKMGRNGRIKAELNYDEKIVISAYVDKIFCALVH